jgi:hypothetical protein
MTESRAGASSHTYSFQRLHYMDWGKPGKPPLVLILGGRDYWGNWGPCWESANNDATVGTHN